MFINNYTDIDKATMIKKIVQFKTQLFPIIHILWCICAIREVNFFYSEFHGNVMLLVLLHVKNTIVTKCELCHQVTEHTNLFKVVYIDSLFL